MGTAAIIFSVLVSVHLAQPYILLTANLEDVHALAKQVASAPVIGQIGKLFRRASDIFKRELKAPNQRKRSDDYDENPGFRASREAQEDPPQERDTQGDNRIERRNHPMEDLINLGKNASFYLQSIKKIFEKI